MEGQNHGPILGDITVLGSAGQVNTGTGQGGYRGPADREEAGDRYQLPGLTLRAGFQGQTNPMIWAEASLMDWSPTLCLSRDRDSSRVTPGPTPQWGGDFSSHCLWG